jgi:cytochrome c556
MKTRGYLALAALACLTAACSPKTETAAAPTAPAAAPAAPAPAPAADATTMGAQVTEVVDPKTLTDASTARDIHNALIIPGSEALFAAENAPPKTEAEWTALQASAQKVIDGMDFMKKGTRPQGRAEWTQFAQVVQDNTKITAAALAKKNADDMVFTDGDMMAGCTSCHQKFRFKTPATATEPAH